MRIHRGVGVAMLALLTGAAAPGDTQAAKTVRGHNRGGPMHAVVVPERGIDPGMRVVAPRMPPHTTPVIRPGPTAPDGTVVVPK